MAYGYDKNTDYTKLINQDVANQDWRSAAIHEAQRNEKVLGEGLTQYKTTNHYSSYLPRQEEISSGMDRLAKGGSWNYDASADPAAQAYRKAYLREADRQTRDTLGNYAQMTGGVPSTAAVAAAQQAGNYQRAQYADKIPELMQADYDRYMQGREADRADLSLLASLDRQAGQDSLQLQQWDWTKQQQEWENQRQQEQQAFQNAFSRWNALGYADEAVANALGVPVGTSTADQRYQLAQQEYQNWSRQQQERAAAYERVMTFLSLGQVPDDAALAAAGITRAQAQQIADYYASRILAGGSGGNGGNPRPTPQDNPAGDTPQDSGGGTSFLEDAAGTFNYTTDLLRSFFGSGGSTSSPPSGWTGSGTVPEGVKRQLAAYIIASGGSDAAWATVRSRLSGYDYQDANATYAWLGQQLEEERRRRREEDKHILYN